MFFYLNSLSPKSGRVKTKVHKLDGSSQEDEKFFKSKKWTGENNIHKLDESSQEDEKFFKSKKWTGENNVHKVDGSSQEDKNS